MLSIFPAAATVPANGTQVFGAWNCPIDASGSPDFGLDGEPGTSDDLCTPRTVEWSVQGNIGTVSPSTGPTTWLRGELPGRSPSQSGQVVAAIHSPSISATTSPALEERSVC